jgi:hypothetical protein
MQFVMPFFVTCFAPSKVDASQTSAMKKNARKCFFTMITEKTLGGPIWNFIDQKSYAKNSV